MKSALPAEQEQPITSQREDGVRRGVLSLCDPLLSDTPPWSACNAMEQVRRNSGASSILSLAQSVAREVGEVIGQEDDLQACKKNVAGLLNNRGCPEVDARTFNRWTLLKFQATSPDAWRELYIGCLRRAVLPSEAAEEFLLRALRHRKGEVEGIKGYLRVATLLFSGNMKKAYERMSALSSAAGMEMQELSWGNQFNGSAQEFREGVKTVGEKWGAWIGGSAAKEEKFSALPAGGLRGIWGYVAYAEAACGGDMLKAFMRMSALSSAAGMEMQELSWGPAFQGTAAEFREGVKGEPAP